MTVLQVEKNATDLTLAITTEFAASVENVWRLWSDASLFERWWGPPGFSVASEEHDLTPGGRIAFSFVSPEGEKYPNVWEVLEVEAPTRLVLRDADVDENGTPLDGNSLTKFEIAVVAAGDKTRMLVTSYFDSAAGMEAVAAGFAEGVRLSVAKAEAALAEAAAA
jgi:uncharacterized protein YndB with AHSA1/START domain